MRTLSKRQTERQKRNEKDKQYLRDERELNYLWQARRDDKLIVKLEKSIQNGWMRSLTLRDDIARRNDAKDFVRILGKIDRPMFCKREDFKAKNYKTGKFEDIPHQIHPIGKGQWDKLGWPEHFKKHFEFAQRIHRLSGGFTYTYEGWWFTKDWMFVTQVAPRFLTHYVEVDPDLESKIDELDKRVRDVRPRLTKLHGGRGSYSEWARGIEYDKEYSKFLYEQMKEWEDPYFDERHDWSNGE